MYFWRKYAIAYFKVLKKAKNAVIRGDIFFSSKYTRKKLFRWAENETNAPQVPSQSLETEAKDQGLQHGGQ